jgi:hypothetical protein
MPYHVAKTSECGASNPWAVIKDSDGKIMGCHKTKRQANSQIAALYANEKSMTVFEKLDRDEIDVKSVSLFDLLTDDELEKGAYDDVGTTEEEHVNLAWELLEPTNKLVSALGLLIQSETENEIEYVMALIGEYTSIFNDITLEHALKSYGQSKCGLMVWKDTNEQYRWFAIYSNCYRDADSVPEIISAKSHQKFLKMADEGMVKMPELWHWHIKGTQWGVADWLAFDEENGMAMASGVVLPGHEKEAEMLAKSDIIIGVSHGMPNSSIKRSEEDNSVIVQHVTVEISDLPLWAAANKLTGFQILSEDDMGLPNEKKAYLRDMGVSAEKISEIEAMAAEKAQTAAMLELDRKEIEEPVEEIVAEEVVAEEVPAETETETVLDSETAEAEIVEEIKSVEETKAVMDAESVKMILDAFEALSTRMDGIEKSIKESAEEKEAVYTPTASLAAIIGQRLSVIGNKDAIVKGNTSLAKDGPEEAPTETENKISVSKNPVINNMFSNMLSGNKSGGL